MMLLVSLPDTEREGEGLRRSSAGPMFRMDDSDMGVSETGVSWGIDTSIERPAISNYRGRGYLNTPASLH